jgi:transcriptional regulator with XRE-family HTH domain
MNRFGQRIWQLRLANGLSLRDLAPQVHVGSTYLSKVEIGRLRSCFSARRRSASWPIWMAGT